MSLNKIFYWFFLLIIGYNGYAQPIDNTSSFKNSEGNKYIRIDYDNDYFTKADEYYTQGTTLELALPAFKHFILSKLLFKPKNTDIIYGLRLDTYGYTPTSIDSSDIFFGDRPYSANISLGTFATAVDTVKKQTIASTFITGWMGQADGGELLQKELHILTGNSLPQGWQHQVRNDVILDYQLNYEKELYAFQNMFLLNGVSQLRVGTHNDKLSTGFNFMFGNFNDRYRSVATTQKYHRKIQYYLYAQALGSVVGYDASLEGGLFNRTSPYVISPDDICRFTFQADYGIVISYKRIYAEYSQAFLTQEFNTGLNHRWGGLRLGLTL
jgi:lipid A 3-O-deacylase